jgi:hypothetical protein
MLWQFRNRQGNLYLQQVVPVGPGGDRRFLHNPTGHTGHFLSHFQFNIGVPFHEITNVSARGHFALEDTILGPFPKVYQVFQKGYGVGL